jgi:hypothetical protein
LKNAKVEFLDIALGKATADRFFTDCAAQNYNPSYHLGYSALNNDAIANKDLKLFSIQPVLPWFADAPAAATFRDAYKQYSGDASNKPETSAMFGWASLEVARKAIELGGSDVTKESVYKGLYALDNTFTANGLLAQPLKFTAGTPAQPVQCYFVSGSDAGKPVMPQGTQPICPK